MIGELVGAGCGLEGGEYEGCHSPALTGAELCYHHTRARRQLPISGRSGTFSAPTLDDRASLQLALNDLYARIADPLRG